MVDVPDAEFRQVRIADLRRRIAAGAYETPEKLEAAVEAMIDELDLDDFERDHDRRDLPR